jgi:hypothetical protein
MQNQTFVARIAGYRATRPLLRLLSILLVLATIFGPELLHHYVPQPKLSTALVATLATEPSKEILDAVAVRGASLPLLTEEYDPQDIAQRILGGTFTVPQFHTEPIRLLDYPLHLMQGPPTLRLVMASLELERLLLEAFEKNADEKLLEVVLQRIEQLDRHESSRWVPDQFLWNDHAIAARAGVLALAWKHARTRKDTTDDLKLAIVRQAARTGMLLASDAHFTARTNHGVMQNLALLQLATAFPALPESNTWARLAKDRLDLQLAHYVSDEGMVLEHSATYQQVGAELLARFTDILALRGEVPSPALEAKTSSARQVLEQFWRPDGSLPVVGNTPMGTVFSPVLAGPSLVQPPMDRDGRYELAKLMPIAGYAVWHAGARGELSQTVIAWGKHDGHGHKHADELSVHFWRDGINWLTATGYWPYGRPGAEAAYGWRGANAPHQINEAFGSPRSTSLLGHAANEHIKAIDLERKGPGNYTVRRQVVQIENTTLLVLDFTTADKPHQTVWTFDPRLTLSDPVQAGQDHIRLRAVGTETGLTLNLLGWGPAARFEKIKGKLDPFAGWVVVDREPVAADALVVDAPASTTMLAHLFHLTDGKTVGGTEKIDIALAEGATPDSWTARLTAGARELTIGRRAQMVEVTDSALDGAFRLALAAPDDTLSTSAAQLTDAYAQAVEAYPQWRDLMHYRNRVAVLLLCLWVAIEFLALAIVSSATQVSSRAVRHLNIYYALACLGFAYFLHFHYFR